MDRGYEEREGFEPSVRSIFCSVRVTITPPDPDLGKVVLNRSVVKLVDTQDLKSYYSHTRGFESLALFFDPRLRKPLLQPISGKSGRPIRLKTLFTVNRANPVFTKPYSLIYNSY